MTQEVVPEVMVADARAQGTLLSPTMPMYPSTHDPQVCAVTEQGWRVNDAHGTDTLQFTRLNTELRVTTACLLASTLVDEAFSSVVAAACVSTTACTDTP